MNPYLFKTNAWIGKKLSDSFFRKMGKKLNAVVHHFKGSVRIEWVRIGNPEKPMLLFLHGFADKKENFYFAAKKLSRHFCLIVPDMPGFGNSTTDQALVYNLENYENWLSEFITGVTRSGFHLAGNSLGAAVAARLAVRHPEKIRTLTLADAAGFYIPGIRSVYDEAIEGVNIFQVNSADEFERFHARIFNTPPQLPMFVKEYMVHKSICLKDWFGKIFNDLGQFDEIINRISNLEERSLNSICPAIRVPVLILWGRQDSLFPYQTALFLKDQIQDARVSVLDHIGHCPHLEAPDRFAKELIRFVDSAEKGAA